MVINLSVMGVIAFVFQTIGWVSLSLFLWFVMYFTDSPSRPTPVKNSIYLAIVVVLFLLIYQIVEINWLP